MINAILICKINLSLYLKEGEFICTYVCHFIDLKICFHIPQYTYIIDEEELNWLLFIGLWGSAIEK